MKGVNIDCSAWWLNVNRPNDTGYITEQQIIYMKEWGCDTVAITIESWLVAASWDFPEPSLTSLDKVVDWCNQQGLKVVLRFMQGMYETETGFPKGYINTWVEEDWDKWISFWRLIASRYRGRVIGYDLINEPRSVPSHEFYSSKMRECIDAIRVIDPNSICFIQAMSLNSKYDDINFEFEKTFPINRVNVIFSAHLYQSEWWPQYDRESIESRMRSKGWFWIVENNRSLWIGEFNTANNYVGDPEFQGEVWLKNFMEICDEYNFMGFCAWWWRPRGRHSLINDLEGNVSASGEVVKDYLLSVPNLPLPPPVEARPCIIVSTITPNNPLLPYLRKFRDQYICIEMQNAYYFISRFLLQKTGKLRKVK